MAPFGIGRDRRASGDGIAGQALVLRGDSGYSALSWWTSSVWLYVTAPGLAPAYVVHRDRLHRDRAPVRGFVLPVDVDPHDVQRLRIRWDETPTIAQRIADSDPAIVDPEGTWRRVAEARGDEVEPSSGMSRRPATEPPWGDGRIDGWPPSEPLDGDRVASTALVVVRSGDPGRPSGPSDYMLPCSPYGGLVADDLHSYTGWLLLCVLAPSGSRYGVHMRASLRRGHLGPVLPVAIRRDKPDDVEIPWRYAPDRTREFAEQLRAQAATVPGTADRIIAANTEAAEEAVAQIADPAARAATEDMLRKFGMTSKEER
ncbi:MAG TPA: hypothetical protein VGI87_02760 [Solirubrobacteraceae bacterium]|jgi:hypothetical protein